MCRERKESDEKDNEGEAMKKTSHVLDRLPEYLIGSMGTQEKSSVDRHLRACKSCRAEYEVLAPLWQELGLLPEQKPGDQLRERFYAELSRHKTQRERAMASRTSLQVRLNALVDRLWPKQPAFQVAIAVLCLLVGYVVGFRIDNGGRGGNGEVAELRAEVQNMQRLVAMSLLKTESASERIKGATWSERISRPDDQVMSALFETLDYDPNVNVRLAALEALTRFSDLASVRQQLIRSLVKQSSPLIQLALVEVIAQVLDTQAIEVFQQLLKEPNLNKTVREQIEMRLKQLKP